MAFEYAEKITDEAARRAAMTFVIVGGGRNRCRNGGRDRGNCALHAIERFSSHRSVAEARVILIEGEPRVLASFPEDLRISATKQLTDLGVELRTGVHATNLSDAGLQAGDEFIPCRVKIWAAGNTASFVGKTLWRPGRSRRARYR